MLFMRKLCHVKEQWQKWYIGVYSILPCPGGGKELPVPFWLEVFLGQSLSLTCYHSTDYWDRNLCEGNPPLQKSPINSQQSWKRMNVETVIHTDVEFRGEKQLEKLCRHSEEDKTVWGGVGQDGDGVDLRERKKEMSHKVIQKKLFLYCYQVIIWIYEVVKLRALSIFWDSDLSF